MKRYNDCIMENSECPGCSLSNYGMDCHNNPAHPIAYFRSVSGLSQQQLSDKSGIVRQQIAKYETGERRIDTAQARTVLRLARALGVTVEDVIE